MELKGNFKVITTGTPVENHLGELWNLFRFINPGLYLDGSTPAVERKKRVDAFHTKSAYVTRQS